MELRGYTLSVFGLTFLNTIAQAVSTGSVITTGFSAYSGDSSPSSVNHDTMRSFQIGNYSYELVRVNFYSSESSECHGHKAKHSLKIMDEIEMNCGNIAELSYPGTNAAVMLLREGNYFDCGRDQLRVDMIDKEDAGQKCVVQYINANGKKWINGAAKSFVNSASMAVTVAVGVLILW